MREIRTYGSAVGPVRRRTGLPDRFPLLDLFGKAGLARTDAKLTTPGTPGFSVSDKGTDLAWGVGAQAHFGSLGARVEYEQFKLFGDEKLSVISASFVYTLL